MEITLKKQWAGHVAGTKHAVSDDRAEYLMKAGVAMLDAAFLKRRKDDLGKAIKIADSQEEKAAKSKSAKPKKGEPEK